MKAKRMNDHDMPRDEAADTTAKPTKPRAAKPHAAKPTKPSAKRNGAAKPSTKPSTSARPAGRITALFKPRDGGKAIRGKLRAAFGGAGTWQQHSDDTLKRVVTARTSADARRIADAATAALAKRAAAKRQHKLTATPPSNG
jgi:hypothetical protein